MGDIRCQCGKILCQHEEYVVVIKCRHCKRTINIGLKDIEKLHGREIAAKSVIYRPKVAVSL